MGIIPLLINFIVTFSFSLGMMQIGTSILAIFFFRSEIPSVKVMLIHNVISALLISFAYTITFIYLPTLYSQAKVNSGVIRVYSKTQNWSRDLVIEADENVVRFQICAQDIEVQNNMEKFYTALNQKLIGCGLPKNTAVYVEVIKSPFHNIEDLTSNSMLRKYLR